MTGRSGGGFTPNLVVGVAVTLAGGALLLDTLGLMEFRQALRFWPVLVVLYGASIVAQALRAGQPGAPGTSQRPIVGPGFVIVMVFLGLLASNALQRTGPGWPDRNGENVFTVMSRNSRTSGAEPFRGADVFTVMGRSRLDLSEATLAPGEEAYIDVFGMMGGVDIIVPEGWEVDVETVPVMGRVRDRRLYPTRVPELAPSSSEPGADFGEPGEEPRALAPEGPAPRLILRGLMMMGALTIES